MENVSIAGKGEKYELEFILLPNTLLIKGQGSGPRDEIIVSLKVGEVLDIIAHTIEDENSEFAMMTNSADESKLTLGLHPSRFYSMVDVHLQIEIKKVE